MQSWNLESLVLLYCGTTKLRLNGSQHLKSASFVMRQVISKKNCKQLKKALKLRQQYKKFLYDKNKKYIEATDTIEEPAVAQDTLSNDETSLMEELDTQEREVVAVTITQTEKQISADTLSNIEMNENH